MYKLHRVWLIEKHNEELRYGDKVLIFSNPIKAAEFAVDACKVMDWDYEGIGIRFYKDFETEDYVDITTQSIWIDPKTSEALLLWDDE